MPEREKTYSDDEVEARLKRELRARAEADMRRDRAFDVEREAVVEAEMRDDRLQILPGALGLLSAHRQPRRGGEDDAGHRRLERQAKAAEAAAEIAVEIEKTEMEARRHADGDAIGAAKRPGMPQILSRVAWPGASAYHLSINEHPPSPVKRDLPNSLLGIIQSPR